MIAIVDYGAGNLMSVKKALDFIGEKSVITSDCKAIETAERVILRLVRRRDGFDEAKGP